jgi:hypothetical protein
MTRQQGQPSRGRRRGAVFSVRVTQEERAALEQQQGGGGPRALGPWLVWRALDGEPPRTAPGYYQVDAIDAVLPGPGNTRAGAQSSGSTAPRRTRPAAPPVGERLILDLCAGSGAWSEPYELAGYRVERVTLPTVDVRTYVPPANVWGILAAPPCNEFSIAKRAPRDELAGLEIVSACMRIILQARPRWWALENPGSGHLAKYLGPPLDSWEPHEFGDPWTKRTGIWGAFQIPRRGPFVEATGSAMDRRSAAARAVTPPGFAQAFFEANP